MQRKPDHHSYELRIGVTGHRNLTQEDAVAQAVDRLVTYLDGLFVKEKDILIKWTAISPLAKGADRMVARSILKLPNSQLKVFLPFNIDEYRRDFKKPADKEEFEELVKASIYQHQSSQETLENFDDDQRNEKYLLVGKEVVDACEILITVWDGDEAKGKGGTADIVKYALTWGRTILRIDPDNPSAPATLLVAPKNKDEQDKNKPFYEEHPLPDTLKKLSLNYVHFTEFVRDVSLPATTYKTAASDCLKDLKKPTKSKALFDSYLNPVIDHLIPTYVRADQLAAHYQKRHVLASKAIHIFAAVAVSVVVFQVMFFPHHLWMISFELCAMAGVLVALMICRRLSWHEKWIDYRLLAEQLRTIMFTIVVQENPDSRSKPAPETLPFYNKPKTWIDFLIATQVKNVLANLTAPPSFEALKTFVIEGWLTDQKKWHRKNAKRKKHAEHKLHRTVIALFCVTLAMAFLHLFGIGHGHIEEGAEIFSFSKWSTFLAITLPAWGAAIHAIGKQLEYERIAARSTKMAIELERLEENAIKCTTLEELRKIVQQAIQTVNLETFEWWALISFNSPELVA